MKIFFGPYKGMEDEEVVKKPEGRNWMAGVIKQVVKDDEYKERNIQRNAKWSLLISKYQENVQSENVQKNEQTQSVTGQMIELMKTLVKQNDEIIKILNKQEAF